MQSVSMVLLKREFLADIHIAQTKACRISKIEPPGCSAIWQNTISFPLRFLDSAAIN